MFSQKGIERLAAILLLTTVVAVVISIVTYAEPIDTSRVEIIETLVEIEADGGLFITSTAFFILSSLLSIPLAAALYLAFRNHDQALALFGAFGFLAAGVINSSLAASRFALEPLASDYVTGNVAQQAIVLMDARVLGTAIEFLATAGNMGIALGVFAFGLLIYRTGALWKHMGLAGMLSGVVLLASWIEFANDDIRGILFIGLLIGLVFALFAGIAMYMNGLQQAPAKKKAAEKSEE